MMSKMKSSRSRVQCKAYVSSQARKWKMCCSGQGRCVHFPKLHLHPLYEVDGCNACSLYVCYNVALVQSAGQEQRQPIKATHNMLFPLSKSPKAKWYIAINQNHPPRKYKTVEKESFTQASILLSQKSVGNSRASCIQTPCRS